VVTNTAFFDYFSEALEGLIARWVHGKGKYDQIDDQKGALVVFIDDLDRCLPEKTVQVLEAVKLFLDKRGCIFLIGADTEVVCSAVESYYKNATVTGQNAADYLDKVIQLRYELPPVAAGMMQDYLQAQAVSEEMLAQWLTLIAAAEVNPRRVKAVVNDIELQWQMLTNSGQAGQVKRDDFIRWSAMMRAAPAPFRQRLDDIDDPDLLWKFLQDALKWAGGQGDETLNRTFQEYERYRRLRRVLREIKAFSADFDAKTLNAFIHMVAPPARLAAVATEPVGGKAAVELEPIQAKATGRVGGQAEGEAVRAGSRTIGGVEFVRVPAGKFVMGSKEDNKLASDDEKPQHTYEILKDYWIARFPLTNLQFEEFVKTRDYRTTAEEKGFGRVWDGKQWKEEKGADWRRPRGSKSDPKGKEQHPVVQVSWDDAMAYCQWFNETYRQELGELALRLPSEAEWEKAARGEYGNEWPWGNEWDQKRCNSSEGGKKDTTPVGAYSPQGDSPYGAADMVGNVWEWTHSL
jgi:formylglycine-generating enzyme required for sulfatase activity